MSDIRVVPEMLWLKNNFDIKKARQRPRFLSYFRVLEHDLRNKPTGSSTCNNES